MLGLLLSECPDFSLLIFIISLSNTNYGSVVNLMLKFSKIVPRFIFSIISIYICSIALTPVTCIISLMVFQISCHSLRKNVPFWLPTILILLSNDIHLNPGPHFQSNFFNFMTWNLNSLAKDNFHRIRLIESHNTLFNYDLISICETSLNDSVELHQKPYLMTIHLCLLTIRQTLGMGLGLGISLRILFPSSFEMICLLMNR